MNLQAKIVECKSKKSGESYLCIEIQLTESCTKRVFLDSAELELIKLYYFNKNNK